VLASIRKGSGPVPTLLLHGFLGAGRNLSTLADRWLARDAGRSIWLLDLPGHGRSPPLPEAANLDDMARSVLAFIADLNQGPVSIVGHSLGGRVAMAAVLLHPASIRDVTILDITPGPIDKKASGVRDIASVLNDLPDSSPNRQILHDALTGRGISASLASWLLTNLEFRDHLYRWRIDRAALKAFHDRVSPDDLWDAVEKTDLIRGCIRGADADFVTESDRRRLEANGCTVVTIANAGHFLHVEQPDAVVEALLGSKP
jgi:esterase